MPRSPFKASGSCDFCSKTRPAVAEYNKVKVCDKHNERILAIVRDDKARKDAVRHQRQYA